MRWTISQKILIGFGLSWLAIVFIGFTGYGITTTLIDYSRQTEHTQQVHDTIHLLREDLVTLEASLYRFVITGDNRFLQPVQPHFTSPAGHLQTLHTLTVNDSHHKEVQARLDTLESAVQQYLTQIAMLEATPPDERIEAARTLVASGPYQTTMREIDGILTTLDEEETTALTTQTTRNRWLSDSAGLLIGLTVVFALAFTVLGGIGLINRISRATTELMRGAREFSLGHLDYRIPSPSHDEMAALAHAYNQMAERLATTQTELHQSNTFFQQLFASSPDAILIINSQGKITHANHTATRLYGYTLAELIELSPKDLVPPRYYEAHSQCTEKYLANPFQHGLVDQQNLFAYTKDGREIPVNILLQTLELEDETLLLCVARDISAQKQAEADLRTQAEQIYDLYNQAPCGYHSVDAEGVFVAINDTELQWLGYAREEIIGKKRNYDLLTPASQKTYWETFERFKESGVIQGLELEYLRADGSILPVILNATAALDTQGNFQMSRATLFDVTELNKTRKALEQVNADLEARVEQRTAELTRSEREFRALAENSLVGIFRTNLKGKVLYANEAMVRILEYPSLAEASNPSAFSHFRDSGDEQAVYTRLQRQRAVENYETDILTYHGKIRTILLSLTLDRTIISGMAIDVTIRKQAEARLQEYNRRMSFLAEASRVFSEASMDYNSVAEQIARHLSEAFGDLCFIRLLSDQQVWENLTAFYDPDPVLREVIQTMMETLAPEALFASLSSQALKTSTPVLIEETLAESLKPIINPTHWALLDRFHKFSLMIIPMHYRKRVIGLVYFFRHTAARRPYTSGDLNLVSELAERAALAITNARLFELVQQELTQKALSANEALRFNAILEQRVEERTAQLAEINFELQTEIYERKQLEEQIRQNVARAQALADFSQALAEAREDYRPVFEYIVRKVSTLIGDTCNISLVSKDGKYLENVAVYHPDPQHLTLIQNLITSINYPLGEGLTGKVAAEGTPILIPTIPQDVLRTQIKPEFHPILEQYGMSSLMIVPMSVRDHIVGIMGVARDRAGAPYSTEEFTFLQDLANRLALAFENIQLFKEALTARHEAEQANQAKSEFLSRISHELRTPLNAILGFAQILSLDELSKGQTRAIQHILTAGKHLLNLINEVLDITRIEAGKLAISPEPIRVKEVVQETFDIVEALASEYQVNLSCSVAPFYYAKADRQRLKQALLNLVTNAIKYNTVNGFVWVKCTSLTEDRLRITVQDTGPGISSELQKRLFIPFDRLGAEKTNVEGTGLGLALSRRLIEAMGGQLGIESELGKGSTFWIELTMEENPLEQSYHPEDGLIHLSPVKAQAKPYQVLYIEDNLSNLQLLEEVFKHRPAVNLLAALDGKTGLEAARQHPLDAILLDLNLPDIPGHEIVLHLKADPKTAQIPIVIISADATVYQQQHLLDIGVYQFLTKPLEIGLFLETIDKILQNPSASPPS